MPPVRGKPVFKRSPAAGVKDNSTVTKAKNGTKKDDMKLEAVVEFTTDPSDDTKLDKKGAGNIFESMSIELSPSVKDTKPKPATKTTPAAKLTVAKTTPAAKTTVAKTTPAAKTTVAKSTPAAKTPTPVKSVQTKTTPAAKVVKPAAEEAVEQDEAEELEEEIVADGEGGDGEDIYDDKILDEESGNEGVNFDEDEMNFEGDGMDSATHDEDDVAEMEATETVDTKKETTKGASTEKKTTVKSESKKKDTDDGLIEYIQEPYPECFNKLRQLTVNIGPVKQHDLRSPNLHKILSLSSVFDIKFEIKPVDSDDKHKKTEKLGFIKLPFVIRSPWFLLTLSNKLGTLNIDGRDMSVKFPKEFDDAITEVKEYVDRDGQKKKESKKWFDAQAKRQLTVKGVPETVTEEQLQEAFPTATEISIKYADVSGKPYEPRLLFADAAAAKKCLAEAKDVMVDECPVTVGFFNPPQKGGDSARKTRESTRGSSGPFRGVRGRGRGVTSIPFRGTIGRGFPSARRTLLRGVPRGDFRGAGRGFSGAGLRGSGFRGVPDTAIRGFSRGRGSPRGHAGIFSRGKDADIERRQMELLERQQRVISQQSRSLANPAMPFGGQSRMKPEQTMYNRGVARPSQDMAGRMDLRAVNTERPVAYAGSRETPAWDDNYGRVEERRGDHRREAGDKPRDDDPMAMMAYIKNTLAHMEGKIGGEGGGIREDYHQAGKRKSDYDDYDRPDTKRQYVGSVGAYDQRESYGRADDYNVVSQRDDYTRSEYSDRAAPADPYGGGYGRSSQTTGAGSYGNQSSYGGGHAVASGSRGRHPGGASQSPGYGRRW